MNNSPSMKKMILFMQIIGPAVTVLINFVISKPPEGFLIESIVIVAIPSLAWIFLVKPIGLNFVKLHITLMKKDGKLPFGKDNFIQFDEKFILSSDEIAEYKTPYSAVEKVAKDRNAIYIYVTAMSALIIPLSKFESKAQEDEFLTFMKEKMQ